MTNKLVLIFVLLTVSSGLSAQISWETKTKMDMNFYLVNPCYDFYLTKALYRENNQRKWRIRLPERMTNYIAETRAEILDINTLEKPFFLNGPVLYLDKAIVISDKSGLMVLDRKNGKYLYDKAYKREKDYFWFDHGYYIITINKEKWKGRTWDDAAFLVICDEYIISFSGYNLIILDKNNFKEIYNLPYENKYFNPEKIGLPYLVAVFDLGKINIKLTGRIYLGKYY